MDNQTADQRPAPEPKPHDNSDRRETPMPPREKQLPGFDENPPGRKEEDRRIPDEDEDRGPEKDQAR